MLVGNKSDLEDLRAVPTEEAKIFASQCGVSRRGGWIDPCGLQVKISYRSSSRLSKVSSLVSVPPVLLWVLTPLAEITRAIGR